MLMLLRSLAAVELDMAVPNRPSADTTRRSHYSPQALALRDVINEDFEGT
ncbi:hypothetical protein [Dactylosporangium matsuzakiense]|uniref:Uncharacterized protein n=1 Tax=Dactylosporangium matsuzakiense TaxID=53360 RepID=A0A9W6NNF3_9ACTN|nr:hypothetical protein [Dactylosporangium matsuzakiense]UWZ44173.1 hypothetical protein Dmats_43445 [Dactylosporangium matsuzakiense]GLL03389.1 hypothetical protein GCM10017581_051340 [Dactylosporangium matsuzakiense]